MPSGRHPQGPATTPQRQSARLNEIRAPANPEASTTQALPLPLPVPRSPIVHRTYLERHRGRNRTQRLAAEDEDSETGPIERVASSAPSPTPEEAKPGRGTLPAVSEEEVSVVESGLRRKLTKLTSEAKCIICQDTLFNALMQVLSFCHATSFTIN